MFTDLIEFLHFYICPTHFSSVGSLSRNIQYTCSRYGKIWYACSFVSNQMRIRTSNSLNKHADVPYSHAQIHMQTGLKCQNLKYYTSRLIATTCNVTTEACKNVDLSACGILWYESRVNTAFNWTFTK